MNIRTVSYAIASLLPIAALEVWIFFFLETKRRSRAIRLHWYVVMSFIFFLGVTYVWKKLSLLFQSNGYLSLRGLARVAAIVVLLMAQSCLVLSLIFVDKEPLALSIASSYCLGFVIFLTISSAAVDIGAWLIYKLLLRRTGPKATAKTLLSLLLALAMTASGMYSLSQLEVNHVTLPIKGLHPSLNGTTLVQLSDIHLGPFSGHSALKDLVGRVNGLKPDLVLITGDLVDSTVSSLREAVTPLKDLTPKHGVYFCTGTLQVPHSLWHSVTFCILVAFSNFLHPCCLGNHEYYTGDVDSWIEELPRHGVTPLVNKRVCLFGEEKQGCSGGLYLAGLEDIETRRIK